MFQNVNPSEGMSIMQDTTWLSGLCSRDLPDGIELVGRHFDHSSELLCRRCSELDGIDYVGQSFVDLAEHLQMKKHEEASQQ